MWAVLYNTHFKIDKLRGNQILTLWSEIKAYKVRSCISQTLGKFVLDLCQFKSHVVFVKDARVELPTFNTPYQLICDDETMSGTTHVEPDQYHTNQQIQWFKNESMYHIYVIDGRLRLILFLETEQILRWEFLIWIKEDYWHCFSGDNILIAI